MHHVFPVYVLVMKFIHTSRFDARFSRFSTQVSFKRSVSLYTILVDSILYDAWATNSWNYIVLSMRPLSISSPMGLLQWRVFKVNLLKTFFRSSFSTPKNKASPWDLCNMYKWIKTQATKLGIGRQWLCNTNSVSERKNCFDLGEYNYFLYCKSCPGRPQLIPTKAVHLQVC